MEVQTLQLFVWEVQTTIIIEPLGKYSRITIIGRKMNIIEAKYRSASAKFL